MRLSNSPDCRPKSRSVASFDAPVSPAKENASDKTQGERNSNRFVRVIADKVICSLGARHDPILKFITSFLGHDQSSRQARASLSRFIPEITCGCLNQIFRVLDNDSNVAYQLLRRPLDITSHNRVSFPSEKQRSSAGQFLHF
jgi:hypothetical protein